MGCSASCSKKKDLDKNVIDPLNNNNNNEKVIQVRGSDNNNVLPLKKRYRNDVQDIQDLLNGHSHVLTNNNRYNNNSSSKATSLTRVSSSEEDLDRKVSFIRSRSYSPGKESKTSTSTKPSFVMNDNKNTKNSVSFEKESVKNVVKVKAISQKDLEEKNNVRNMNKTPKKTPKKKLLKSKKKRNESMGYNSETSSMMNSSLDDKNILDTIKSYLDSVKQNNYNEKREHSLQVISMFSYLNHNFWL